MDRLSIITMQCNPNLCWLGFCRFSRWKSIDDTHFHQSILPLIYQSISTHNYRSISSTELLRFADFVSLFVNFGCRWMKGERRGDSIETPPALLPHHRFATNTLGHESGRTTPSPSLITSLTLVLRPKAWNARTVRSGTSGTTMTAYSTMSAYSTTTPADAIRRSGCD